MAVTRKILLDRADRLQRMPVATDSDLDRIAVRLARRGVDVIDLSRAVAPSSDKASVMRMVAGPDDWRPASDDDLAALREAVSAWYERRFGVRLDSHHEVEVVPNATIALCLLTLAFVDIGDIVLLPDPGLPFYRGAVMVAGGEVMPYQLWERNDFLPSFPSLEAGLTGRKHRERRRTRLMVLSYPHNPTTAMADLNVLTQAVAFARRQNILVVFDAAFAHATSGATRPRGFLETTGARGVGVEIFPIDTNLGLPDLPLAIVAGNRDAVNAVSFLTAASGLRPSRWATRFVVPLLQEAQTLMSSRLQQLEDARRILVETFSEIRWLPRTSPTVPFLWVSIPGAAGADGFCRRLLRRTGVRLRPGTVFGERGEGFVWAAIPESVEVAATVAERLRRHAHLYQRRLPRAGPLRRRRRGKPV